MTTEELRELSRGDKIATNLYSGDTYETEFIFDSLHGEQLTLIYADDDNGNGMIFTGKERIESIASRSRLIEKRNPVLPKVGDILTVNHLGSVYKNQKVLGYYIKLEDLDTGKCWHIGTDSVVKNQTNEDGN